MKTFAIRAALAASCLLGSGCGPAAPAWTTVFGALDRAVLSAWGPAPNDVFFAGGTAPAAGLVNPLAMHFDGQSWRLLDASAAGTNTLWATGGFSHTDAWFVGELGTMLHWDGTILTPFPSITNATLFGVWAAAHDDVWAVGGAVSGTGDEDVLLHFDGAKWSAVEPPKRYGVTYFKVSGTSANDVFVVAAGGLILHYDGKAWSEESSGVQATLFSVSATANEVLAVGGPPLIVLSRVAGKWSPVTGLSGPVGNGVSLASDGSAFVVALGGFKLRRQQGVWIDETKSDPRADLHAVWNDGTGNAFVVGGSFAAADTAKQVGVIGRYGSTVVDSSPVGP